jgi:hypothetical protein
LHAYTRANAGRTSMKVMMPKVDGYTINMRNECKELFSILFLLFHPSSSMSSWLTVLHRLVSRRHSVHRFTVSQTATRMSTIITTNLLPILQAAALRPLPSLNFGLGRQRKLDPEHEVTSLRMAAGVYVTFTSIYTVLISIPENQYLQTLAMPHQHLLV